MDGQDAFHSLQLNYHLLFDDEVNAIATVKVHVFIDEG